MAPLTVISRQAAREQGLKRFFTGEQCQHGHVAERLVTSGRCHECHRLRKQELWASSPEKYRSRSKQKYQANPSQYREYRRNYYQKHSEAERFRRRKYYEVNTQVERGRNRNWKLRHKEWVKYYQTQWSTLNLSKVLAANARRRAALIKAAPPWVNKEQIETIYKRCQELTLNSGILHHVDHIVPLKNKIVCGLHVPWNLQILTAEENLKKRNKFPYV